MSPRRGRGPVERFHTQAVAGQQERLLVTIPDAEGEHAQQSLDDRFTPVQVSQQEHFGVRGRPELKAGRFDLVAELRGNCRFRR